MYMKYAPICLYMKYRKFYFHKWQYAPLYSYRKYKKFFIVQLSHPYMTTGKTRALTIWTFVSKMMSLLFNMLSRFVIAFLPRSKQLLISWLQSPSAGILEPKKIKSVVVWPLMSSDFNSDSNQEDTRGAPRRGYSLHKT